MRHRNPSDGKASQGKWWMIVALIATLFLLLSAVTIGTYLCGLLDQMQFSDDDVTISQEELQQYIQSETEIVQDMDEVTIDRSTEEAIHSDDVINILLVGQDARPGESRARADTVMVCSYHKTKKTLTVVSFMRDMYVQIPGYPDHKLNAAFAWGGMDLLSQTLQWNFGIEIAGGFWVDFSAFEDVVDAIGGLDIYLTAAEARYLNPYQYQEGINHLDGVAILTYCRIRGIGNGDFDRTVRQQNVIHAVIELCRTMEPAEQRKLLETILPLVGTNMDKWEILQYTAEMMPAAFGVQMNEKLRIPAEGAYQAGWASGMWVLIPDLVENRKILRAALYF